MPSSFTLTADVKLNPQSLTQSASQVKQALGRITGQASEFQKSLDASTARVFAFGATTVVLNSVSQAFRKLISSTIEVEQRIVEINAIFQQSQSVINSFRETIFDVAQDTGQAFETVADAAGELARQGLTAEETATRLQAALILTRISGLGAEDSVKTLTAAINGFTSAALDAEEVTNKIVAVDTAFAVSAQDLAQGLARAGSTAEDAGVSFDQLLGLITAVEQRTARGGAVIGNAFKSIFTRLSRGTTIEDLKALGVEIDATQTGVQKLQALSNAIEGIGDPTVVSKIKELAGGVFQINVVSAALKDLTSETSVFKKATVEAANASNDAYKRNEELNKSLAAQINSLVQGITNLAAKIGTVTFGPLLTNLVSIAGKITEVFNNVLDPEKGNSIVKGFIKGIGAFISGPGLVIITAAFLKIVKLVAKFAADGFKAVLQIGSAAEKISQIEGGIVDLLSRDEQLRKIIASTTATQAQKEEAVISAIKRENQLLNEQKQLLTNITRIAAQRGVTGFNPSSGFSGGGRKRFSQGYVPNYARSGDFALEEQEAISLGASRSVRAKKGKGTIGGRSFIMNDQETEIPNFGRNGDSAVIPSYAKGFIPNFVDAVPKFKGERYVSYGYVKNRPPTQLFTEKNTAGNYPFLTPSVKNTYNELVDGAGPLLRQKFTKWKNTQNKETVSLRDDFKIPNPSILVPQGKSGFVLDSTKSATEGFKKIGFNFPVIGIKEDIKNQLGEEFEGKFNADEIEANAREDAVKQANAITGVLGDPRVTEANIKDPAGFTGAIRAAAGAVFDAAVTQALQLKANDADDKKEGADFDVRVTGGNKNLSRLFAGDPTPTGGPLKGLGDFKFSSGAQKSMKGKTLKELRTQHSDIYNELKEEKAEKPKKNTFANDPTDPNPKNKKKKTAKRTPVKRAGRASGYIPNFAASGILGELMRGGKDFLSPESKTKEKQGQQLAGEEKTRNFKDVFARGFIPNFALPKKAASFGGGGALGNAIKREKDSGLPTSKIRVEQSQKLVNRDNPTGLAVTNTRDEPRGLKDVFASGYVPNFAQKKEDTLEEFKKKSDTEAKTKLLYSLEKRVTKVESEIEILKRLPDKDIASNQVLDNNFANRNSSNQVPASSFASGYVPNFTRRGPLGDAIKRERDSGLPTSKIRVEQSSRLANRDNPSGLAVTNTRDEPRGLRDVFASGYVPNFASLGGGFAGFDQRTVSAQKINELEGQLERAAKSTGESSDDIDRAGKAATRMGAAFAVITTVTSITSSVEAKYAAEKQKAIKKETDKLAASNKQLEAQKKEIQASDKSASAKKREIASIDLQIAVLEKSSEEEVKLINSKKSLVVGLGGLLQGVTQGAFALQAINDVAGEGGLLGALGRGKTALGGLVSGANSITKKLKGDLTGKLDGLRGAFSNLGTGIAGFLTKLNNFKLPKIGTQVAAQAAGQATGQAVSGTAGGLIGGFLATAKDWAIKAGKFLGTQLLFVLRGFVVTLAAIFTPITALVALVAGGIYLAIAKGADYFGQKTIDALNKKGDEGAQNIINSQADRAVGNAPKEADLVAAIAEASAAGEKGKDEAAILKIQLEGVRDLEVAAKAYKEFGNERVDKFDEEGNFVSSDLTERAKKSDSDFRDANKRSKRDYGASIVATNKAISKQKEDQLKVEVKIGSTNAEILKNQSKIAALQAKEALVRQNTIADLNRAKSLLPKDILAAGGGSLVDFQVLGEQVKAGKKDVFNKEQAVSQRTSEVDTLSQKVATAETPEEEAKFQAELDTAAEALTTAEKDLVSAQSEYSNVIKNGAVQTQSNLTALADKIKNSGSKSLTEAFEKFEEIATSENIDPSQYKSAADQFFKTLDTEVKRQFAQNAIAAGDFYNKVVKNLQNPEESAKDIDTVIAGLKAANDPKNTNQEKANISAEISPLIDKLKATYGEESATFQAILKEAGLSPEGYKKQQRDIAVGQINSQTNISEQVKKAQIADFDKQAKDKEKYKPEKFKDEQKALFDNFALLQNQLNKFRKVFPDADKILTESENLAKSLKSVGGVVDNFKSGLSGLTAFGKNADEAIQESNKNIEGLNKSTSAFSSQLETLNKTEKSIADKLVVLQAKLDKILGTTGGGGGTE